MNFLNIFKGNIDADGAFKTLSKGIDNLAFTNQERIELNIKLADKIAEFAKDSLSESTIRSKSRRIIAYCIVFSYLLMVIYSLFTENMYVHTLVTDSPMQTAFIMVLAFFFGGYYIKQFDLKKK